MAADSRDAGLPLESRGSEDTEMGQGVGPPGDMVAGGNQQDPGDCSGLRHAGEVQEYLGRLAAMPGQEVPPRQLLPPFNASRRFRWAYPVRDTGIYHSLTDAARQTADKRAAEVQGHRDGPNLGSAGGSTLQPLGATAFVHYQGLLAEGFR